MIKYVFLTLFIGIISFCVQTQTDPNDINDIILWYSADSVTQDSNNNAAILHDKSGNGFNAVQTIPSRRPNIIYDFNNHPSLSFSGYYNYMDCDFNQTFNSPNTFFIILKDISTAGNKYYFSGLNYPGGYSFYHRANLTMSIHSGSTFTQSYPKSFPFDYTLFTIQYNNGSYTIRENGIHKDNGATGTGSFNGIRVGGRFDLNYFFEGNLAEMVAYNRNLGLSELTQVESYLMNKYAPPVNVGIDSSHYSFCNLIIKAGKHFTSYLWSDGSTADSLIPSQSGTYWVEVEDIFGNISSDTIDVQLPEFQHPTTQLYCPNDSIIWDTGLGQHYTYLWSDGSTGDTLNIASPGAVHVVVTDTNGCVFKSDTLTFSEDPFSSTATLGPDKDLCSGNNLGLTAGANEATNYVWNTSETTSEIEITTTGTYSVIAENANGCNVKDTIAITIIGDAPNILADVPAYVCTAAPFAYEDLSSTTDGSSIVSSDWNFGNGETASATQGSFAYATAGNYDITLTIATSSGCFNTTTVPIEVKANPSLSFTSTNSCQRQDITFNGGQLSPEPITAWSWNFGDPASGTANTANGQNTHHLFETSGDFDVMLVGTDIFGCIDTLVQSTTIDPTPNIDFTFTEVCEGNVVNYQNASTITAPATISTYQWNFGDGTNSGQADPQKPYAAHGNYTVTLTATANNGCSDSESQTVKIHATPQVNYTVDQACAGIETEFTDNSFIPNGSVAQVDWSIDGQAPLTGFTVNANFDQSGSYTLEQTVQSAFGCMNTALAMVEIADFISADFEFSPNAFVTDYPITFESTSTGANEYQWTFGDFATSQSPDTSIVFDESQIDTTYEVALWVRNIHGCSDSVSIQRTVLERTTDLELSQLFSQEVNGFLTLGVQLKNVGTTPITSVDLFLRKPGMVPLKETWEGNLQAGESENYIFSASPSAAVQDQEVNQNYLCIEGRIVAPGQFSELNLANNEVCTAVAPTEMALIHPYPNPVNDQLTVKVVLPKETVIGLHIYDNQGRKVHTITENEALQKGLNVFYVNTSGWSSGSYKIQTVGSAVDAVGFVKL
ncbi:hypothetical protein CW751_01095 [Brumimicrobium salinarum]|uniref:PKD domain-containing protein n=1 Tax=Brumimicrobium salinarum TaxID=2058658 RepID=A0A2I0R5V5_9FLAO|nr:PKD domain-containing protein [Brumimicrobium salinarum]PKR81964.1 hypothetical protein CW751_01095 [Brumimicrobium salinarum]